MRVTVCLPALALIVLACKDPVEGITVDFIAEGTAFSPVERTTTATRTTMVWGFRDGPHNVTWEDGTPTSGNLSSGTYQRAFGAAVAGTYRFRCTIHSTDFTTVGQMNGRVIVP